ncbi:MAG: efflux RND transporter periplasmic adaptor subunit [Bacteroidales bacterium]|nr:efflux RND transporter periplasmic adaptor subunit [Bacteroidales bacterium]
MKTQGFLLIAAAMTVFSCKNASDQQHTSFETLTVKAENVEVPYQFSARLVGDKDVKIIPQVSGQLTDVCISQGQRVRKGQTLFIIDKRESEIKLQNARADLQAARAEQSSTQLEYESNLDLFKKGIISTHLLDKASNDNDRAKAAVAQAEAAVMHAKLDLDYHIVTSPVDGIVGDVTLNPGDLVSPAIELTTVAGSTEMRAMFSITEYQLAEITGVAGNFEKVLDIFPNLRLKLTDGTIYSHEGHMKNISGVINQSTGSALCTALFPNPDGVLFSGIQGTVQIPYVYEDMIVIPQSAIVRLQDRSMIYKVVDNCAKSAIVEIMEINDGKKIAVTEGLEVGEVIVAKGASNVFDGQQVIFPEEKTGTKNR